ncbi:Leucine Rich repeat-containing protein [Nonomuraea solani]|uniref:Leucine Rich repeat-containing protein n=1 Tax=Nonomuraea solani TaxID=1144553 RepID=A0A1H6F0F0_9ACTN|nr:cytoplasmic protein [Nonomuraea solani]SEH03627.1 Leucine Rich repeat-containing protein [Nonomuraea solani]
MTWGYARHYRHYPDGAEHPTSFAGSAIVDFGGDEPDGRRSDETVAWRISIGPQADDDYDEDLWDALAEAAGDRTHPIFRAVFEGFLDVVPPDSVEALVVGRWGPELEEDEAPIQILREAAERLTKLKAMFVGEQAGINQWYDAHAKELLAAYPQLEILRIRGGMGDSTGLRHPLTHTSLRHLAIESGELSRDTVAAILESDLPALEHLELWFGDELHGGPTVDDLAPILSGARWPRLRYLGLRNAEIADEIAMAVATAPVVTALETLDLSLGTLSDTGAEALLTGQPLTHLRKLDLHHHFLSQATQTRLLNELPGIVDVSDGQGDDVRHRYTMSSRL